MKAFPAVAYVCAILSLAAFGSRASNPVQDKSQSLIGVVVQTDVSHQALTIHSDSGATVSVQTDTRTTIVRIPAGERTLANAVPIQFGDIMIGDRVLSNGSRGGESFQAQRVVVMPAAEVEKKRQHDLDDWKQRGVGRSEEHTSELQSHSFISYAVFC